MEQEQRGIAVAYDFEVGDDQSDLALIVESKRLHAHKLILGIYFLHA
jgi:hypothetical protein